MAESEILLPGSAVVNAEDLSNQLLTRIFGADWWALGTGQSSEFAPMFHTFLGSINSLCLTIIAVIMLYSATVGAIGTGRDGSVGGKDRDSGWSVLRFASSIGFVSPIFNGLGFLQLLVLAAVGFSINGANLLWSHALEYFQEYNLTGIIAEAPPTLRYEARAAAEMMYQVAVIQEYLSRNPASERGLPEGYITRNEYDMPSSAQGRFELDFVEAPQSAVAATAVFGGGYDEDYDSGKGKLRLRFLPPGGSGVTFGDMGTILIPANNDDDDIAYARAAGMIRMFTNITNVVAAQFDEFYEGATYGESGWLEESLTSYENSVAPIAQSLQTFFSDQVLLERLQETTEESQALGWASIGAYAWKLSRLQEELNNKYFAKGEVTFPDFEEIQKRLDDDYAEFSLHVNRAKGYWEEEPDPVTSHVKSLDDAESLMRLFGTMVASSILVERQIEYIESSDPVVALSWYGSTIVDAASVAFGVCLAAYAGTGFASGFAGSPVWNTVTFGISGGLTEAARFALQFVSPLILSVLGVLVIVGFLMAYAIPAIPMIYWAIAVAHWAFRVIEHIVGAPFWMVGKSLQKGEGYVGETKVQMIQTFELMIRPALMVIGFVFSLGLAHAISPFVGQTLRIWLTGMYEYGPGATLFTSMAGMLIVMALYWYLIHSLYVKGINHLPRHIIRWIGGQSNTLGTTEEAEKASRMVVGVMQQGGAGLRPGRPRAGGKSSRGGQGGGESQQRQDKKLTQDLTSGTTSGGGSEPEDY